MPDSASAGALGVIAWMVVFLLHIPNHPSLNWYDRIGRWLWARMKRASRWLRARMFVRVPDVDPIPRARVAERSSRAPEGGPRT